MRIKTVGIIVSCCLVLAGVAWFGSRLGNRETGGEDVAAPSIKVVSTIYPWSVVAKRIAGSGAEVTVLTPVGVEPHDFEPSPRDILSLREANLVIINGAGIDSWAEKLRPELEASGAAVLVMADGVALRDGEEHHEEASIGSGTDLGEGRPADPHFWLDPTIMASSGERIAGALGERFPKVAAGFQERLRLLQTELDTLDREYRDGLAVCQLDTIVVSHDAYGYLAGRYGFVVEAIAGLSPEMEPSSRRMADIADFIRAKGIDTVFFETLIAPRLAETIARETGARILVLNPIEGLTGVEEAGGKEYFSIMRENLDHLRLALRCASSGR